MPSKKKLAREVRWLEKAIVQCGRDALRLEVEREQARSERDRALSELFQLRAAAGHVVTELADIDLDAEPKLVEQVRELRGLLDMGNEAPAAPAACRETIKKIRTIDFRDSQVTAVNPAKFGEPGTFLINSGTSTQTAAPKPVHRLPGGQLKARASVADAHMARTIAGMKVGVRGWVVPWAVFQHEGLVWLRGHHLVHPVPGGTVSTLVERRGDGYCVWYSSGRDPRRGAPSNGDVPAVTFWFGLPSEEAA